MPIRGRDLTCLLLVAGLAAACGGSDGEASSARAEHAPPEAAHSAEEAQAKRAERPLPAFSGWTLDGERLEVASLIGRRLVIHFFDPAAEGADAVSQATVRIAELRGEHNFALLGVSTGSDPEAAREFVARQGIEFPVIDDSARRIAGRFGLNTPFAMLGVDAEGYVVWGMGHFPTEAPDAATRIEDQLRSALRLPELDQALPGDRPLAPTFQASMLDGDVPFDLAATRGEAVLLLFFLHTCPHCHEALEFLKGALADLPEDKRPRLFGIELTGRSASVRRQLSEDGLDFFPVLWDPDGSIQAAYSVFGGVPDLILIDREGRIAGRVQGWRGEAEGPLLKMRMAQLAGAPVPMLLRSQGYSGSEVCGVCHTQQHETWRLTNHSRAFDTLVKHGESTNPECVGCHVVGFGETGGYRISPPSEEFEDVGCESCHGRGGPHLSPEFARKTDYSAECGVCHDPKHSLGFEYASFLPKVSHAANAHILMLPAEERQKILAERGALRTDLLPTAASHTGSEACRSCHPKEFATWQAGPHAGALASLEHKGRSGDADCLRCHTTGFGRDGGFVPSAATGAQPDLARVGCESCHGPGGDHVGAEATKLGSIVSLGDKCDSCVILQICGSCHDDANDPGFEFEVQQKIDRIRHGTIEAGTGKPLVPEDSASRAPLDDAVALARRAFAAAEGFGP